MQTISSKLAGGVLLSLLFAPPAAADLFSSTGSVQTFTAPVAGVYKITADGASGGDSSLVVGGLGAEIGGEFTLTAGEILSIYVGIKGNHGSPGQGSGGGGGGSFVIAPLDIPLIVAGGGGGGGLNGDGGGGLTNAASSDGGSAGNGGGGGGFTSNGGDGDGSGGKGFPNLSAGLGPGPGEGGFGGGGAGGLSGGGGGGGYSGGDGGGSAGTGGGGGGSFDGGIDQILDAGVHSRDGKVEIDLVQAAVPEPASCVLLGTLLLGVCAGLRKRSRLAR